MRRILQAVAGITIVAIAVVLTGCRAKEAFDKASIARDLDKRGTTDLMKQVADDKYTPPADGKLTDAQVQMYLKVREHEKQIAQVARQEAQQHADAAKKAGDKSISGMVEGFKTLGSVADMATADIRAAKDLHYNTQEYLWVKAQILEVSTTAMARKATQAMSATLDSSYQQMKKAYDEAKDEQTKKMYGDMLAGYEKQKKEMGEQAEKESPALAYNRQLVSKYEDAINAYANELEKWSDKPGEAQKSVQQWNQEMDKTIQQAKEGEKK